jgi:hypothetical protein
MKQNYFIAVMICLLPATFSFGQTIISGTLPCSQTLALSGSPYTATSNIIVSQGCVLTVNPGVEIKMAENTHLIIKGKANFMGTAAQNIRIHATDTIWGNIFLDSTLSQKSSFNYVTIENARMGVKVTQEPGAIYGYFSTFEVKNCSFKNNLRCTSNYKCPGVLIKDCIMDSTNRGEKIHGQYCNAAIVDGNTLYATRGDNDGIDFDASNNVMISNNKLYYGGDDGIDIGQCDSIGCDTVIVQGNTILGMFNKGVSNGEYCKHINLNHNVIAGCAMGIGSKSGSVVKADHNTLYLNRVGVSSYVHLDQIWGPGNLTVSNCIIAGCDTTFHADPSAFLAISYSLADDTLMPGTGNIKGNPSFVSPSLAFTSDFHLTSASAAIDTGDPAFTFDSDGTRSDMGAFFYNHILGIKSNTIAGELTIYPNPSDGLFTINVSQQAAANRTQLKILNFNGQTVYSDNLQPANFTGKYELNLGKQPKGIYYIQLVGDKSIFTNKLLLK